MPDAIAAPADWEHDCVVCCIVRQGHWLVLIGSEPRIALVETATHVAEIVVQGYVFAIDATGELRRGNFYLGGFVGWYARVSDCDSPQHGGLEGAWWPQWVHVSCFVADVFGDARIVRNHEGERTHSKTLRRDHCNCRAGSFMRNECDEFFRRNETESGTGRAQ